MRDRVTELSRFERGLTFGTTGNISVRINDGWLIRRPVHCLETSILISKLACDGWHLEGDPPTTEAFLQISIYEERPKTHAVVHLYSTHSVTVSGPAETDSTDALQPLTASYVMRVGKLPMDVDGIADG